MVRIAVFCSGSGSNFEAIAGAAKAGRLGAAIALMVCDRPEAFAVQRARRLGVPYAVLPARLFPSRSSYEKLLIGILKRERVDLVALAGWMRILSPVFIRAFRGRILNIHPSCLPAFKGAHAIRDAFQARVPATGVTVHVVTADVDGGPVLAQTKVRIGRKDTLKSLETKIHRVEHRLYPSAIRRFIQKRKGPKNAEGKR